MSRQQEKMDASVAQTWLRAYRTRWPETLHPFWQPECAVDRSDYPQSISLIALAPYGHLVRIRLTEKTCDEITRDQQHTLPEGEEQYPTLYAFLVEQLLWL